MKSKVKVSHVRIEILAQVMRESPKAWLLDDGVTSKWVPRSLVERVPRDNSIYDMFNMPEWLAYQKGFI